jgi:hypothetical protein
VYNMNYKGILLLILAGILALSCDEQLPGRENPPTVLVAGLSIEPGPTILEDSLIIGRGGEITIDVTNIYDEVLQDSAQIKGVVEFWVEKNPTLRTTVTFDQRALQNISTLFKGVLTLRVSQRIFFSTSWSQRTDSGEFFWRYVPVTELVDGRGKPYLLSDTLFMAARATIQVYQKVQPLRISEIHYPMTYIIR